MIDLTVRIAVTADAEAIVRTHHESVWNTARHHYQPDVLDTWAVTLTDDSYEQVRQEIADAKMVVLVAESNLRVAGFGMIVPADEELREFYGKHGYEVVERATHRLRSGHEMACVRMTKRLR
jgi:hypothetical protein